ncbi:MAG: hypothetical protein AAB839_01540 [Patescibacteria group bacterium]
MVQDMGAVYAGLNRHAERLFGWAKDINEGDSWRAPRRVLNVLGEKKGRWRFTSIRWNAQCVTEALIALPKSGDKDLNKEIPEFQDAVTLFRADLCVAQAVGVEGGVAFLGKELGRLHNRGEAEVEKVTWQGKEVPLSVLLLSRIAIVVPHIVNAMRLWIDDGRIHDSASAEAYSAFVVRRGNGQAPMFNEIIVPLPVGFDDSTGFGLSFHEGYPMITLRLMGKSVSIPFVAVQKMELIRSQTVLVSNTDADVEMDAVAYILERRFGDRIPEKTERPSFVDEGDWDGWKRTLRVPSGSVSELWERSPSTLSSHAYVANLPASRTPELWRMRPMMVDRLTSEPWYRALYSRKNDMMTVIYGQQALEELARFPPSVLRPPV